MNTMLKKALRGIRGPLTQLEKNIICGENGDEVLRQLNRFNRGEPCWVPPTKSAKVLALEAHSIVAVIMACVATFMTPAVTVCDTKDCFVGKEFWRDSDVDSWLTSSLPATEGGETKVLKLVRPSMTFKQIAQAVLNETSDDINLLGKRLIEAGKTFSPKQVEERVLAFQNGDKSVALLDNGWANFWFVHDDKGNVFVLRVYRYGGQWSVYIDRLDHGHGWDADYQLFLRN